MVVPMETTGKRFTAKAQCTQRFIFFTPQNYHESLFTPKDENPELFSGQTMGNREEKGG